ncbi:putative Agenet-like domain-containing protein [Helianthus anomalus]
MFTICKKVEVSFERESLRDCWVPTTILKNSDNTTFLVEYQQRGTGDEASLHKIAVDYLHIRPSPPHLRAKNFALLGKVDAYYDFGWWSGVITKELPDNRYNVYFKHTKKEREFIYSRVRPHMEWKGGQWFNTSQGGTDVKDTPSLIDEQIKQKTTSIDKECTLPTSTMK